MKPCPFCASNDLRYKRPDERGVGDWVFWCGNCGAFGPNDVSEAKAREMWNLRRPMDALLDDYDRLMKLIAIVTHTDKPR